MKKTRIILSLLAVVIAMVTIYACAQKKTKHESVVDISVIPVKVTEVTSQTVTDPISASGFVSSETEARLSFKTGGVIQKMYVTDGQAVRKGQLLATLNLTEVNAGVEQANQVLEKAQRDYDRAGRLYKDTVASLEQYQNATTGLNVAKQQYAAAKFNASYSEIRASNDGVIVKKMMNEGEIVAPGAPVFYMNAAGSNDWVVKVGIADKDWARLTIGNEATIRIDAFGDEVFHATVSKLAQAPDALSGLYQVELKIKANKKQLATGLFAKAEVIPLSKAIYVIAPIDAIVEGSGKNAFVYTIENAKAKKLAVTTAFIKEGNVMITSGLAAGQKVITDGSAYLTDGADVQIAQ